MKLYEYQGKEIFSKYGIGIQKGKLAKTPQLLINTENKDEEDPKVLQDVGVYIMKS